MKIGVLHPKSWTLAKASNKGYISKGPARGCDMSTRKYSPEFKARVFLRLYEGMCPRQSYVADTT